MVETLTPLELMTKLISFPTVSRDSNLPLIDWVEEYLTSHGITCHRYYDDDENRTVEKAALFAHVGHGSLVRHRKRRQILRAWDLRHEGF
jgi:acetylornithine deacetylase